MKSQYSKALLRYHVPSEDREAHLDELLRTCDRVGCAEVMLFTSGYLGKDVYLDEAGMERRIDHLGLCADRIRAAGLAFSLNVMHTLGHLFARQCEIDRFGFERQRKADGSPGGHPVLDPSCPALPRHLRVIYGQYAGLRPRLLFVDDDFTVPWGQCFHPLRVSRFASAYGCMNAGADVEIALQRGTGQAREIMSELITADLEALAQELARAAHAVSPETRLGVMHPGDLPADVARVARALAGPHQPYVRPQIPLYREDTAGMDFPARFNTLDIWRAELPEDFEFYPECENYPYDPALKSSAAALLHHAYCLASGEPSVALSLNSFSGAVPACESTALVDAFARHRGEITLVSELAESGEPSGVAVWADPRARRFGRLEYQSLLPLQSRGVPVRFASRPGEATLHWGNSLAFASNQELDQLPAHGAVLDSRAVEILRDRGFLARTGLTLGERCRATDMVHIRYERHDHGHEDWPFYYFVGRLPEDQRLSWCAETSDPEARTVCPYLNEEGQAGAPHIVNWTGPEGGRFSFVNARTNGVGLGLLSPWSTRCLVDGIEWVLGNSLPAKVVGSGNFLLRVLRVEKGRGLLLLLANLGTGLSEGVAIRLDPKWATASWQLVTRTGREQPLDTDEEGLLHVDPLPCLGYQFLRGKFEHR